MVVTILEVIFWASFGLCAYVYFGYPLLVYVLGLFRRSVEPPDDYEPFVSIVIAAYNEEKHIREKLENTLALDYPRGKRQIIVGSDGSTDKTAQIANEFADRGIIVLDFKVNRGKTAVQNECVRRANGEVLVFMDAASMCNREALRKLVRHFANPRVGCVAGKVEFVDRAGNLVGASQGLYWKYEQALKRMESRIGALVGVDGPLYAVRREAYVELSGSMQSDLITPLLVRGEGLAVVLESGAVAFEDTTTATSNEFRTRRRVVARGLSGLVQVSHLLNLLKHGFLSFQILSHKLLRWCVGLSAIIMLTASLALSDQASYAILALAQVAFYGLATLGFITAGSRPHPPPFTVPYYFVLVNVAALAGIVSFLKGNRMVTWRPVRE